jgi:uncharacterized protein YndB with AHSA1/START domain
MTTTETTELLITRIFDAPRELVFECMITPEHLTHFWGPIGMSAPVDRIVIDARPGGDFKTVMVNDESGEEYPTSGVFTVVDPPETLEWREPSGAVNRSTFVDLGDGRTEVRIHQMDLPTMFATPEARAGFETSLDRFAAYLQTVR